MRARGLRGVCSFIIRRVSSVERDILFGPLSGISFFYPPSLQNGRISHDSCKIFGPRGVLRLSTSSSRRLLFGKCVFELWKPVLFVTDHRTGEHKLLQRFLLVIGKVERIFFFSFFVQLDYTYLLSRLSTAAMVLEHVEIRRFPEGSKTKHRTVKRRSFVIGSQPARQRKARADDAGTRVDVKALIPRETKKHFSVLEHSCSPIEPA